MFDQAWMKRWQGAVNSNGPMSWIGKHFNAEILIGFGDKHFVVSFVQGKIADFSDEIGPETCYQLAVKGPATSWDNDIWAMGHPLHGRVTLEGDQMVMWQNMRAFTWALDRMREI